MDGLFDQRPWFTDQTPVSNRPKGMLGPGEGSLLFYLARDYFQGRGEIIDAGAFLGSSSYCLAKGVEENARITSKSGRIHAYDLFEVWLEQNTTETSMARQLKATFGIDVGDNESTLPLYCANVGQLGRHVKVHVGDITKQSWSGRPIEILFIDICKTKSIWKHVVAMLYRSLIPQIAVLIHQDYHHPLLPFIHVGQERLARYFEIVERKADDSAAFRLADRIPDRLLDEVANYDFSRKQEIALMDSAIERMTGENRHLRLAKVQLLLQHEQVADARRLVEELAGELPLAVDHFSAYHSWMMLAVFRELAAVAGPPDGFDEQAYLEANGDVAEAVRSGWFASGLHHWLQYGQSDNRPWRKSPGVEATNLG